MAKPSVTPILVVGSPRSGTTMIGHLIGSSDRVLDLAEYGAFFFVEFFGEKLFHQLQSPYTQSCLDHFRAEAVAFAERRARRQHCRFYCDATPLNLLACRAIAERLPTAIFVLCVRHYSGVIQSLERCWREGYAWAGATWVDRASLWASHYERVAELPLDRTVPLSYDLLCQDPERTIGALERALRQLNSELGGFDQSVLATSHAASTDGARPTIGTKGAPLSQIASFDAASWSPKIAEAVTVIVADADRVLRECVATAYVAPPGFTRPT